MIGINDIREHIAQFNLDRISIAENCFEKNEDLITWYITRKCNFNCTYCQSACNVPEADFDLKTIEKNFDRGDKKWHILFTGGEPFIKPNIIEIFEALTKKHDILINTNLSTSNIEKFASRINPQKVLNINIGCHVLERERMDKNFSKFVNNINLLQDKKFLLFITYVFHPELINRIEKDFDFFISNGVKKISLKPMFGPYNNAIYPDSYTARELEFLERYYDPELDLGKGAKKAVFYKTLCLAGQRTFFIDENGFAKRCENCNDAYGNFFDDSFFIDKKARICNSKTSPCPFQCIFYAKERPKSFWNFLSKK
jgi:MoaA/NifB/PqqE/SkfB family radical SAM enzyme